MRKRNIQVPTFYGYSDKNLIYVDEYGCQVHNDWEHSKIHDGDHYFFSDYYTVAGLGTLNIGLSIDGYENHFTYSVTSDQAGFTLQSWEGSTYNDDGTVITPNNSNRSSANITSTVFRLNPTNIVTGSNVMRRGYAGTGGNPSSRTAGSVARSGEVILKKNTKYLIRVTNLSSSNNDIMITMNYYETE